MILFSFLFLLVLLLDAVAPTASIGFHILYSGGGIIVLLSLLSRARNLYQIKGNRCSSSGCSDGCNDMMESIFCGCCKTLQLGHHLFDYEKHENAAITYESVPGYNQV
jgi:hypothetical protein